MRQLKLRWHWAHLTKVIPKTCRAHYIWQASFFFCVYDLWNIGSFLQSCTPRPTPWYSRYIVGSGIDDKMNNALQWQAISLLQIFKWSAQASVLSNHGLLNLNLLLFGKVASKNKSYCLVIRIMCSSGATCLPADCCFSETTI